MSAYPAVIFLRKQYPGAILHMRIFIRSLALLLLAWFVTAPVRATDAKPLVAPPHEPSASNPFRVSASGSLSESESETGDTIRFWLTIENHSSQAIHNVRLKQLDVPAFTVQHLAWRNDQGEQHCDPSTNSNPAAPNLDLSPCGLLAADLAPEQSLSLVGELRAVHPHERHNLTALLEWQILNDRVSQSTLLLGEAVVRSAWGNFWSRAYEALKDFALPIVLALLAFGLGLWDHAREGRRQAEERHRTQLAETWNRMLSESHRLTTKFYLHIASGGQSILQFDQFYREEAAKAKDKRSDPRLEQYAKRQLFSLVYLERRYIHLLDSAGGFYFKSRVGEQLVNSCLDSFLASYTQKWKEEILGNLTAMARIIDLNETGDAFLKRLAGEGQTPADVQATLTHGWTNFQAWRAGPDYDRALSYLRALLVVLLFEMNRPYEYWYGEQQALIVDKEVRATLVGLADAIVNPEAKQRFSSELEKYLKGGQI